LLLYESRISSTIDRGTFLCIQIKNPIKAEAESIICSATYSRNLIITEEAQLSKMRCWRRSGGDSGISIREVSNFIRRSERMTIQIKLSMYRALFILVSSAKNNSFGANVKPANRARVDRHSVGVLVSPDSARQTSNIRYRTREDSTMKQRENPNTEDCNRGFQISNFVALENDIAIALELDEHRRAYSHSYQYLQKIPRLREEQLACRYCGDSL